MRWNSSRRTSIPLATAFVGVSLALAIPACNNKSADPKPTAEHEGKATAGVLEACETRKTWEHQIRVDCTTCFAKATTPKCGNCGAKDYSGRCAEEEAARRAEPSCTDVHLCTIPCKNDCACLEKCLEGKDTCAKLTGEVDQCTATACSDYCK